MTSTIKVSSCRLIHILVLNITSVFRFSIRSRFHFLGFEVHIMVPWANAQTYGLLSIHSNIWKMGPGVYTQSYEKWVHEHTLNHVKNGSLSERTIIWKMGPWVYAPSYEKWVLEHTLKHIKNESLSTSLVAALAYAQGPIKWPFEWTLNEPLSLCSMAVWEYAQGLQKTLWAYA